MGGICETERFVFGAELFSKVVRCEARFSQNEGTVRRRSRCGSDDVGVFAETRSRIRVPSAPHRCTQSPTAALQTDRQPVLGPVIKINILQLSDYGDRTRRQTWAAVGEEDIGVG